MRRIRSLRSGVVLMGHPVSMDTEPTSAMVAIPTTHPTARRLRSCSRFRLLRRVRLHNIAPRSDVGSPGRVRQGRLGNRVVRLPPPYPTLPPRRRGQLRCRYHDLAQLVSRPGASRRGVSDEGSAAL